MTIIAVALAKARQSIDAREAGLLLCHLLGCNTAHLAAHRDDELDAVIEREYAALIARRHAGEPIAYLVGRREFYGRAFRVAPGVLIPRPETELIVDIALRKFARDASIRILDLGTGSGCLAITLACELPCAEVTAVDISCEALDLARSNALALGARPRFIESDWFVALEGERFDLIVANPPYIAADDPHLAQGDLKHEPEIALASGADGLDAIRRIAHDTPRHLERDGWLLCEHGYDQGARVRDVLATSGYRDVEQFHDIAGILRVSAGRRPYP